MSDAPLQFGRRAFLSTGAKLGAVLVAAPYVARAAALGLDTINVALIGCGEQGRVLLNAALRIPNVRFRAICDIWPYNRTYGERLLRKFGHEAKPFEDYRDLLSSVPELDAVLIATPDFMHAEHTNACLRAGRHVYCEKLMSNTVEGARSMVRCARETGRLLQVGHQRRSNPRYRHALERIVDGDRLLGRVTNASGQWNRAVSDDLGFPARQAIPEAVLHRYGYGSMHEFRNWRWFRQYAGGPIADLGAHQIDIFNWFLDAPPTAVLASGGRDYYPNHDWYDNVFAVYEYATCAGPVRASYQVLTTTSAGGGYHEYFMGDQGALKISENPHFTRVYREARAPDWQPYVASGCVTPVTAADGAAPVLPWEKPRPRFTFGSPRASVIDVRETAELSAWDLPVRLDDPIHQPHLENFFTAIRGRARLNCPGETAFASAVTILRVNDAIAAQQRLAFAPDEFVA